MKEKSPYASVTYGDTSSSPMGRGGKGDLALSPSGRKRKETGGT